MGWAWIKKCPVFCVLTVSGLMFSLVGIIGKFSMYQGYEFHAVKQPFLALVMEGIDKGVAPWEAFGLHISMDNLSRGILSMDRISMDILSIDNGAKETVAETGGKGQDIEDYIGESSGLGSMGASAASGKNDADTAAGSGGNGGNFSGLGEGDAAGSVQDGGEQAEGSLPGDGNGMAGSSAGEEDAAGAETEAAAAYGFQEVPEEYFNDAVFIGDSRTVGLYEYGGIEMRADFFAKISLTIYNVFTEKVAKDEETGGKITVEEALQKKQYGKVYLMLGINELGTGTTESFMEEYRAVVGRIRELQPDAVIFVEGIMRVTGVKSGSDPIFNNTNINEKNDAISGLANNRDIFYIDVNEAVCDGNGDLNAEYTTDEVHLKAKYYEIWKEFLLRHGVVRE